MTDPSVSSPAAPIVAAIPARYGDAVNFTTDVPLEFPDFFLTCTHREFRQPEGAAASAAYTRMRFEVTQIGKHVQDLDVKANETAKPVEFTVEGKTYLLYTSTMPDAGHEPLYPWRLAVFPKQ